MAFQIKDFASISASMVNWMRASTSKVTDFNIGSVVRTLVEAAAAEIDELYQRMLIGLREAIPVSVYNSFSFERLDPIPASGLVRVSITPAGADVMIPAGTVFSAAGAALTYTSSEDALIEAGDSFVDIQVVASDVGVAGNIAPARVFTLTPPPPGFVSASNLTAFINGLDRETDDARKQRFIAYIDSLNRGTVKALEYGLKTTAILDPNGNPIERVASASIIEPWLSDPLQPVALVKCYVHNGVGSTSSALVTRAAEVIYGYTDASGKKIPGWKAAGVKVEVYAATEQAVPVSAVLTPQPGYEAAPLVASATSAIAEYIRALPIGETCVRAEIVAIGMEIPGVYNFVVSAPASDTVVAASIKLMPGAIDIT